MSIQTALIAAGSAFLGALVPSVFSYLGKRQEFKNAKKVRLNEIKIQVYEEYFNTLQNMVQNSNPDNFSALQSSTIKILMFADKGLANIVNDYIRRLVQSTTTTPLTKEQHMDYQTKIINEIRKELGYTSSDLEKIEIVRC